MIHANTCADGYWTDITRTYTAGTPTDRQNAMRSAIAEARENAFMRSVRELPLERLTLLHGTGN